MKKVIICTGLFLIFFNNSYGQWYFNKYHVTDINLLKREQLEEALTNSKKNLVTSGLAVGIGGLGFLLVEYGDIMKSDDPTFFEQLMGDKGMRVIGTVFCAGIVAGGTIAGFTYLGRISRIKSLIHKNYPSTIPLDISFSVLPDRTAGTYIPAVRLGWTF